MIWQSPAVAVKVEYRLYYDDHGRVITYTCEDLEGNYILVDALTFAQSRPDVKVIDGKILTAIAGSVTAKLIPGSEGQRCVAEDISIVISEDEYNGETKTWKLMTYEL